MAVMIGEGEGTNVGVVKGRYVVVMLGKATEEAKVVVVKGGCVVVIIMEEWEVCCDCYDGEVREEAKNEVIKGGMCRGNDDDGGVGWS